VESSLERYGVTASHQRPRGTALVGPIDAVRPFDPDEAVLIGTWLARPGGSVPTPSLRRIGTTSPTGGGDDFESKNLSDPRRDG
jgi:hypothetical protein